MCIRDSPWTYQQVDKDAVLKHTYDCFYSQGGCCAAVFAGIMETMGEAYGAPYNAVSYTHLDVYKRQA